MNLADLYEKKDFKDLKTTCETQIKTSMKHLKSKKNTASTTTTTTTTTTYFNADELTLARAFLATAFLGLYKYEDAQAVVDNLLKTADKKQLHDYRVLRLVKEVLLLLHQSEQATTLYATAYTATKGEVSQLGDELFLAYGRTCDFMSQQKLAMKMYRKFKFPKYAVWAATAIMLQLSNDPTDASKQPILLMTAERLISKVASELQDQGQACELYLNVLEDQQKYKDAIDVLTLETSLFAAKPAESTNDALLVPLKCSSTLPAARLKLLGSYHILSSHVEQAMAAYKRVLSQYNADDWEAYLEIITLVKTKEEQLDMDNYFKELALQHPQLRGPSLGRIALACSSSHDEENVTQHLIRVSPSNPRNPIVHSNKNWTPSL
jgi:hypothetical protein